MIRVAMIVRSTLFTSRGGDTMQVLHTARFLRHRGIMVDVRLSNEPIQYSHYKLLHFFNLSRPADILHHVRKTSLPFVVSTILVDYSEYDKYHRKGLSGLVFRFLPPDSIEYLKVMYRWIKGNDKTAGRAYAMKGQNKSILEILQKAALLLPNSASEYRRLRNLYSCQNDHIIVPNAVDANLFRFDKKAVKDPALVLCVARIEGIKNQLNLIRALNNTAFNLVIIGDCAPNQRDYHRACLRAAAGNVQFIGEMPQEELVSYYQKATVHVLPSWFETTGLSSLESASMGCNIVITDKGDTKEYFGGHAQYCSPDSPESILAAVERASRLPPDEMLRLKIANDYTWQKASLLTAEGYHKIINKTWNLKLPSLEPEVFPTTTVDSNI